MRDELDELLTDFAHGELAGQIGKTAPAFAQARARKFRNRRNIGAGLAAMLAVVVAVIHFHAPAKVAGVPRPAEVVGGTEMVSEQVWYRDVPGPLVVLQDNTPAQVIYRQVYRVCTTVANDHNATQTQASPAQLTLLVRQPVY